MKTPQYYTGVYHFAEFHFAEFRRIHSVANQKSAFPKKCPWGPPLGGGPGQSLCEFGENGIRRNGTQPQIILVVFASDRKPLFI